MSRAATDWAWDMNPGKAPLKLILLSMADRADEDHCCFPSIDRLVKDTSLNKKTVQAGINELAKMGLIKDTGERRGPTRRVRVFRLMLNTQPPAKPNKPKIGNVPKKGNVTENGNVPKNGTLNVPENGVLNVPENGVQNRSLEPVIEPVDDAGASSSSARVIDYADQPVDDIDAAEATTGEDPFLSNLFSLEPNDTLPATTATAAPAGAGNRFAMHFEWVPSQWFAERCRMAGVSLHRLETAQQEEILGEFRSYWEARGDQATQAQWEHKLLRQLQRVMTSGATGTNGAQATRQQKRAAVTEAIMDINDTDW